MIHLDYRDPRPIYEQVYDALRNLIVTGVLTSGEKLPSVRELAGTLAINPNTIQRAYRELEADGYLCSVPGKGSFASGSDVSFISAFLVLTKHSALQAVRECMNDFAQWMIETRVLKYSNCSVWGTCYQRLKAGMRDCTLGD